MEVPTIVPSSHLVARGTAWDKPAAVRASDGDLIGGGASRRPSFLIPSMIPFEISNQKKQKAIG